jgi:hypothetical protein
MNPALFFQGSIINSQNSGLTQDDLIDMWNIDNADDPVSYNPYDFVS